MPRKKTVLNQVLCRTIRNGIKDIKTISIYNDRKLTKIGAKRIIMKQSTLFQDIEVISIESFIDER